MRPRLVMYPLAAALTLAAAVSSCLTADPGSKPHNRQPPHAASEAVSYPGAPEEAHRGQPTVAHTEQGQIEFGNVAELVRVHGIIIALMNDGSKELVGFNRGYLQDDGVFDEWCECPTGTREWYTHDGRRVCLSRNAIACSPLSPDDFMVLPWYLPLEDGHGLPGLDCMTEDYGVQCGGLEFCSHLSDPVCIDADMAGVLEWDPCDAWDVAEVFVPCP